MISFVGAGPGDPGLLTMKAYQRLKQADVVIYDRLVQPLLLFHCSPTCQLIYVGKTPYQKTISQTEINQCIVASGQSYKKVVRLKGGDPLIFGRLTEELAAVKEHGFVYEIIPGITSASGAAAYSDFSLTERGVARSVTFLSGQTNEGTILPFQVKAQQQTLCLYMGMEQISRLSHKLLAQGLAQETPVAVIEWGTWGKQRRCTTTLFALPKAITDEQLANPALVIVGAAAKDSEDSWFDQLPNRGCKIVLVSTQQAEPSIITKWIDTGADVWWLQLGPEKDLRFAAINQRVLSDIDAWQAVYLEEDTKKLYEEFKQCHYLQKS